MVDLYFCQYPLNCISNFAVVSEVMGKPPPGHMGDPLWRTDSSNSSWSLTLEPFVYHWIHPSRVTALDKKIQTDLRSLSVIISNPSEMVVAILRIQTLSIEKPM